MIHASAPTVAVPSIHLSAFSVQWLFRRHLVLVATIHFLVTTFFAVDKL